MAAPVGPKKVHRYTVEFKVQAVRSSMHPEIQPQDVAHADHLSCCPHKRIYNGPSPHRARGRCNARRRGGCSWRHPWSCLAAALASRTYV